MPILNRLPLIVLTAALCACAPRGIPLPGGAGAYSLMNELSAPREARAYRIGDADTLRISVFQEPELSLQEAVVDVNGNVTLPLIGDVPARGRTSAELASDVRDRLARYLTTPQVTVGIVESTAERVFVEGEVEKPGVFPLQGDVTLLNAIAMAEGTSEFSDNRQVVIFRTVDGTRYGAKFDLERVRTGVQPDPLLMPQDLVVVGVSSGKQWVRTLLQATPVLGSVFIALHQNQN